MPPDPFEQTTPDPDTGPASSGRLLGVVYHGAGRLADPVLRSWGRLRFRAGTQARADWAERLALSPVAAPSHGPVWVHAASVGELASAKVILTALDRPLVITTNSTTGRAAAARFGRAMLAPIDTPAALRRFLDREQPAVAVTVENEIWPGRASALAARAIPHIVIGARISDRSARRWARAGGLIHDVLAHIHALSAQNSATEDRLIRLGLRPDCLLPRVQLKLLAPAGVARRLLRTPVAPPARPCLLAASTHEGEDAAILDAYLSLRGQHPDLRLILAPRHPERGTAIAALMAARNLSFARRSTDGDPDAAAVILADSLGEMPRWYAQATLCFTGGSLVAAGGHTPWEPAAYGLGLIHGPHVENFAEDYHHLTHAGAARVVQAGDLAQVIAAALPQSARMGHAARDVLLAHAGDPAPLIRAIALAHDRPRPDTA